MKITRGLCIAGRGLKYLLVLLLLAYLLPVGASWVRYQFGQNGDHWYELRRDSSSQIPDFNADQAVIQVYSARAARWRGAFGVHTWIATRRQGQSDWQRLEVIGYRLRWMGKTVQIRSGKPDNYWFGNYPELLREVRGGADVEKMIDRLHLAAQHYPHDQEYAVWPGPNSNTFIAYLARAVPELQLELPVNAIGKDYLPPYDVLAWSPSGKGVQFSAGGYAGVMVSAEEGFEVNLLGLSAGVDLWPPAIKLPGLGRLGLSDFKLITLGKL